jgi:hypothetical protein
MMRIETFSSLRSLVAALLIFGLCPDPARLPLTPRIAAQEPAQPAEIEPAKSVDQRTAHTRAILEQSILDFDYDSTPFSDFLGDLKATQGIEVFLDDSSDLKLETPISFELRNVRLSMALELLFGQHNSQFVVRDGILLIASNDKMAELNAEIRVYNCRDLVGDSRATGARKARIPCQDFSLSGLEQGAQDKLSPQDPSLSEGGAGDGSVGGIDPTSKAKEAQLTSLIKAVVAPTSWKEVGKSATVFDGLLVVNQTATVHEQIQELLTELRQATDGPANIPGPNPK